MLKQELSLLFQRQARTVYNGAMISVTIVRVTPDLKFARVYLSLFVKQDKAELLEFIKSRSWAIRKEIGGIVGKQLRVVPDFEFHIDDSLDYAQRIDDLLKE